ncbi:MAG: GatB/YqeY domain-containing protein [Candidatus Parcubacteria bacterium]|nr:GatB/YqeY domain-containing protein [Candidatus Parcubacteria bacterium]
MSILEQIEKDFQQAFKERKASEVSTLRLILAALKNERIKKMADLDDDDVSRVMKSEIKKRKEAISDYEIGARQDLADREKAEIKIIEKYLPAQLEEKVIREKIKEILKKTDQDNLGKLMGQIMKDLQGQADGNQVRKILEEEIAHKK